MLVECNYCGAPLDVGGGKTTVKCRYCDRTSQLQTLRTVSSETPRGWKPPPVWTPPAHMPAGAAPLRYHGGAGATGAVLWMIGLGMAVAVGIGGAVFAIATPGRHGFSGRSLAGGIAATQLAPVTLRESPEQLAKITRATMDAQRLMRVPLSGSRFDAVTFEWDAAHLAHVKRFYFNLSGSSPQDEPIRKRLRELLGRRFDGERLLWEGCGLYFPRTGGVLNADVDLTRPITGENPYWKEQAETLWAVVKSAALGLPGAVDPQAVRDWLGGGYPFGALASLDTGADVDRSEAAVKALFRGAVKGLHIDLTYKVALDHPWFGHAELSWPNKKASQLEEVELRPPPGDQKFQNQPDMVTCTTAALGKPDRESEGDHLRGGGKDYTWRPKDGGEVRIYEHMVMIRVRGNPFAPPMPKDRFQKIVQSLDECGRAAR